MDDIRERLLRRDYLYTDAAAYRAGVEAAWAALAVLQTPVQAVDEAPLDAWSKASANG